MVDARFNHALSRLSATRPWADLAGQWHHWNGSCASRPDRDRDRDRLHAVIGEAHSFVLGVVGWVDFEAADASAQIARLAARAKLVGLRPMIQDMADVDWMLSPKLAPAFEAMIDAGLVFDALTLPRHLPNLLTLLEHHPDLRVVIDHGSKPEIAAGAFDDWAMNMSRIAHETSAFVKLSGLVNEAGPDWSVASLKPYVDHLLIKLVLPRMIAQGGGSIINMSSVASSIKDVPNRLAYCASKAAVIGLTKSVAADFVTDKIRCNAICPGTVDSPSMHQRLRDTGDYDTALKDFIARQPLGRIGTAQEMAALALYLASDDSAFTTGQCHVIDGGWAI